MQRTPSAPLKALSALVRAPLLGEPEPPHPINAELAKFAVRRHRVGPLLHIASQALGNTDSEAAALLATHFEQNKKKVAKADVFLRGLAARYFDAKLPWLTFKGTALARQLYPKVVWRQSNDVDILVTPDTFMQAQAILQAGGMTIVNTQLPPDHWIERAAAALGKDVMLRQAGLGISVELHRRLFFARAEERHVPLLRDALRPRLGSDAREIPSPPLDAGHALYLLLHGAGSRWFRLKWLMDVLPLLTRLTPAQQREVASTAEDIKAAVTVKATLKLLRAVFGDLSLGEFDAWLREATSQAIIDLRADGYLQALDSTEATTGKHDDSWGDALKVYYETMDNPGYRGAVLLRGGAWIALRGVRKFLHRTPATA